MRRRKFLQNLGLGASSGLLTDKLLQARPAYLDHPYHKPPQSLAEAKSQEGYVMVRLAWAGKNQQQINQVKGQWQVEEGELVKSRHYFFEPEPDEMDMDSQSCQIGAFAHNVDVVALWLGQVSEATTIRITLNGQEMAFHLEDLLKQDEITFSAYGVRLTVNLLFDREVGTIDPASLGIHTSGDDFRFAIMADPQGGNPDAQNLDSPTRMKIHNAFIEESIQRANELDPSPAFTLILGDFVDSKGQKGNFDTMLKYYGLLNGPKLLEVGNHETPYSATFSPGYNMSSLNNYFSAQKTLNGMDKILYSFDLGQWHFIVWPDPLRGDFWPNHPHYFEWLERDLDANKDRPVIFMNHVPLQPIGINPLVNYVESVDVKRTVLDILATHGNVKYVLSGHVHIPLKAAVKTAVSYKGMQLINLPPTGYRPRAFGEPDYYGGPSQGLVYVDIRGGDATVSFKTVTKESFTFPQNFPALDTEKYPLWLSHKWELPAQKALKNGNFANGLTNWHRRYVYREDKAPSNVCEVRPDSGKEGGPALYLYNRERGYPAPGQDRLPQTINRICQAVQFKKGQYPRLAVTLKPDKDHFNPEVLAGAYIWVEGYEQSLKKLNLVYSLGKMYQNLGGKYSQINNIRPLHFDLPAEPGQWYEAQLNLFEDYRSGDHALPLSRLNLDRLVINLGVWTINDGMDQECGVYFDNLDLSFSSQMHRWQSKLDQKAIKRKEDEQLWTGGIDHVAGEHQYVGQEEVYRR